MYITFTQTKLHYDCHVTFTLSAGPFGLFFLHETKIQSNRNCLITFESLFQIMAKSHAQRQKEYRERKKAEMGSNWLEKESKRNKKYFTKVGQLTKTEAKKRRQKLRIKQIDYRERKIESASMENES